MYNIYIYIYIYYICKIPQKLTTTVCFIQRESSGGRNFENVRASFMLKAEHLGAWVVE